MISFVEIAMRPTIHPFFDPATWTVTYVVFAGDHAGCAIIASE